MENKKKQQNNMNFTKEKITEVNRCLYNLSAEKYETKHKDSIFHESNQKRIKLILEEIIRVVKAENDKVVLLDAGCGTGNVLCLVKDMVDELKGIDISPKCIEIAQKYTKDIKCGDISNLPYSDESVNIVTAYSVLHHLFEYSEFIKESFRVLKKGGFLYTDFDHNSLVWRKILAKNRRKLSSIPVVGAIKKRIKPGVKNIVTDYKLANFHNEFKGGLNPFELKKTILKAGFSKVDIFFYQKKQDRFFVKKNLIYAFNCPYIYCIAQK